MIDLKELDSDIVSAGVTDERIRLAFTVLAKHANEALAYSRTDAGQEELREYRRARRTISKMAERFVDEQRVKKTTPCRSSRQGSGDKVHECALGAGHRGNVHMTTLGNGHLVSWHGADSLVEEGTFGRVRALLAQDERTRDAASDDQFVHSLIETVG